MSKEEMLEAVSVSFPPRTASQARPQSAPFFRTAKFAADEAVEPVLHRQELLKFEDIVQPEALAVLSAWWFKTKPRVRAHARWIFEEPDGLPQPRQRVRRMAEEYVLDGEPEAWQQEDAERLAGIRLRSSYSEFFPEPVKLGASKAKENKIWLMAFAMSHAAVLKKGAVSVLAEWLANGASARKQSALTEILYSLHEFCTSRQGATMSGVDFQQKPIAFHGRVIPMSDPFQSRISRPSSAPIAPAVHRKFEAQKRQELAYHLQVAREHRKLQNAHAGLVHRARKGEGRVETQCALGNPLKWPVSNMVLTSSNKEMMASITPTMRANVRLEDKKRLLSGSSGGCGRLIGDPKWHGNAMHAELHAQAKSAYPWARRPNSALPQGWARESTAKRTSEPSLAVLSRSGYREHSKHNLNSPLVVRKHSCGV